MKTANKSISFSKELILVATAFFVCSLFLCAEWQLPRVHKPIRHAGFAWLIEAVKFYYDGVSNKIRDGGVLVEQNFNLYYTPSDNAKLSPVSIYDPIFYASFCAFLWKIIGGPSLWSLKILNIIIFSLILVWLYRALEILFDDKRKAFIGSLGVLLYFPLLYTNILTPRDAHHYYSFVIFLYFVLSYVFKNKDFKFLFLGALLFVFCQWVRPPLLSSFVVLTCLMMVWSYREPLLRKRIHAALSVFWLVSILCFWFPFCIFNKITYDKYFLSALGENMLSSLYGTPLPNGDALEHSMGQFVLRKTGHLMLCGQIKSDDICMDLYKEYVVQFPFHAIKCMVIRLKQMLWYDLPWREYDPYMVTTETSRWFKFQLMLASPLLFLEFFARLYIRILLILGYLGITLAFIRKEYALLVFLIIGVVLSSGYSWLFHIEDRVLAVHNWPFGIFAAYWIACVYEFILCWVQKRSTWTWHLASTNR